MTHPPTAPAAVHVVLPGNRPPWTPAGITVARGDRVTLLGSGWISWSATHGAGAKYHLWGRVAGGEIFGCTQDTTTVVADRSGPLELCVYLGAWADRSGRLATGEGPYGRERGSLSVTVLRWPAGVDPVDGLAALPPGTADADLVAAERTRLLDPVVPPAGWSYLLAFGPGDIYRHVVADGRPAIDVVCEDDAGILTKEDVWADHDRFVGPPPRRIESAWLVAVSHFGHRTGHATFRDIVLRSDDRRVQVL